MRNVLWPLMNAGVEGFKVHAEPWLLQQQQKQQPTLVLAAAGMCCMLCCVPHAAHLLDVLPACRLVETTTAPHQRPTLPCPICLLLPQPDKVSAGDGILSPLDIPIPGAEPGKKDDYYYHDRSAHELAGWLAGWQAGSVEECLAGLWL